MKDLPKKIFYTIAGLPLLRKLGSPWRGRACVLCYHRVMPDQKIESTNWPNSSLIMPVSSFEEQMKFLAKKHEVVSMEGLLKHLSGRSNKFVVSVTFDDGYKDNLSYALPILEKFQIPVTIYITTRFPEGDTSMWWYEIWDYLKENKVLELNFLEKNKKWDITSFKQKLNCFSELGKWLLGLSSEFQKKALLAC